MTTKQRDWAGRITVHSFVIIGVFLIIVVLVRYGLICLYENRIIWPLLLIMASIIFAGWRIAKFIAKKPNFTGEMKPPTTSKIEISKSNLEAELKRHKRDRDIYAKTLEDLKNSVSEVQNSDSKEAFLNENITHFQKKIDQIEKELNK